jgi:hypothetical protein
LESGSITEGQFLGDRYSGFRNGGTAYASENSTDVVYVCDFDLWKYAVGSAGDPSTDYYEKVGRDWIAVSGQGPGAYDPTRQLFVKIWGGTQNILFWDLSNPGPNNKNHEISVDTGTDLFPFADIGNFGMDFDATRGVFILWDGNRELWELIPPANPVNDAWPLRKLPVSTEGAAPDRSAVSPFTGILGKWKYIKEYDVFVGLFDPLSGDIWIYKPNNWQPSVDLTSDREAPEIAITSPVAGVTTAGSIEVTVDSLDVTDHSIVLFAGGTEVGEDFSAPYEFVVDTTMFQDGELVLRARGTDAAGNAAFSNGVKIELANGGTQNVPPSVALSAPADGSSYLLGDVVSLSADASDSDGSVSSVEFFANGLSVGVDTVSPYAVDWTPGTTGSYTLTVVATDDVGASTTSASVGITVSDGSAVTVTLQDGTNGYQGTADVYLDRFLPTYNRGGSSELYDRAGTFSALVRFAIFQSEGGPVPDGATITSATLSLYKLSFYDHVYAAHRVLVPWTEFGATWSQSSPGVPWSVAGADGVGTDIASQADDQAAAGWDPGWLAFDVTASVQEISVGAGANHGWRLYPLSGNGNIKRFHSREYAADPLLRPSLTLTYSF